MLSSVAKSAGSTRAATAYFLLFLKKVIREKETKRE
jgi:hypothetical protein